MFPLQTLTLGKYFSPLLARHFVGDYHIVHGIVDSCRRPELIRQLIGIITFTPLPSTIYFL